MVVATILEAGGAEMEADGGRYVDSAARQEAFGREIGERVDTVGSKDFKE
jgi:hypothetical protein